MAINPYGAMQGQAPAMGGTTNPYMNQTAPAQSPTPYQGVQGMQGAMPDQAGQNPLLMAQMLRNQERNGGGANNLRGLPDRVNAMMPGMAVNNEEMGMNNVQNNQGQLLRLQEQGLV